MTADAGYRLLYNRPGEMERRVEINPGQQIYLLNDLGEYETGVIKQNLM